MLQNCFSRVRKLTNDVETLMGGEDTEVLIATLSELIQILSRYDTYTFGEDVGRTVFYRNLLEGIVNGRQQVNPHDSSAQQQAQSRQLLNDQEISPKDSALGADGASTLRDDTGNSSEEKTTQQKPKKSDLCLTLKHYITEMNKVKNERFNQFTKYVALYNKLLSAWVFASTKNETRRKTIQTN